MVEMVKIDKDYDYLFTFLIIGDSCTGKTCILLRYSDDKFKEQYMSTIGVDFLIRTIKIKDKKIKNQLWDTAGQERFRTITKGYYKNIHGIIIVYDVTDQKSFDNVKYWFDEVEKHSSPNVLKILVGNKCDLVNKRVVSKESGEEIAQKYKVPFYETSAKDSVNIERTFIQINNDILESGIFKTIGVKQETILDQSQSFFSNCCS